MRGESTHMSLFIYIGRCGMGTCTYICGMVPNICTCTYICVYMYIHVQCIFIYYSTIHTNLTYWHHHQCVHAHSRFKVHTHVSFHMHRSFSYIHMYIYLCVQLYIHVQCTQTWLSGTITTASMPTADSRYTHMFLFIYVGLILICICTYICVCNCIYMYNVHKPDFLAPLLERLCPQQIHSTHTCFFSYM